MSAWDEAEAAVDAEALALHKLQLLVNTALDNANENEYLCDDDDTVEARSLMDYDSDVFEMAQQLPEKEQLEQVALCVHSWKNRRARAGSL